MLFATGCGLTATPQEEKSGTPAGQVTDLIANSSTGTAEKPAVKMKPAVVKLKQMASFDKLNSKYQELVDLIKASDVRHLDQDGGTGKLVMAGAPPSERIINRVCNDQGDRPGLLRSGL